MEYHIAKGVFDILPKDPSPEGKWREVHLWHYVESKARLTAKHYGFQEIRTPIFEHTELFKRGIGNETDIVSKEMYSFEDKGGRHLSLRPEGTAPVMRAFIEKRLDQIGPVHKLYYLYSMFRYERQQAGRYRQHHQFGAEVIGVASAYQDVEVIDMLYTFLKKLGLRNVVLNLNSIGNQECRKNYREALKSYLSGYLKELSSESQTRFQTNAMRILDSKNPHDQELLKNAPSILDFLDPASKEHFAEVCELLQLLKIPYVLNSKLVRGLDYYNRTVFEVTANELGAQNSLGGGGRYDGLLKELGGSDLPAIGFGAGIERIIHTLLGQAVALPEPLRPLIFFIPLGESSKKRCFHLLNALRHKGIAAEMELGDKKLKSAMRYADTLQAKYVAVIGDEELQANQLKIKKMQTGEEEPVNLDHLCERLQKDD